MPAVRHHRLVRACSAPGVVGALLVAGLATASPAARQSIVPSGTAAISGIVVDALTKKPVAGASVSLRRTGGMLPTLPRMVTDRQGRFVFVNLPPADDYFLDASHVDYATTRYGWTAPNGPLTVRAMLLVRVADGQWVNDVTIPLWQLGTIEGQVVDELGEPLVGVAVRAFSLRRIAGREQLVGGPIVTTDDRGVYRMADLEPDRYVVGVLSVQQTVLDTTPEARQRWSVGELASGGIGGGSGAAVSWPTIDVDGRHRLAMTNFATPPPPNTREPRAYQATFYPAATTIATATPIEIDYGDARRDIDFRLQPVPTVRVSGRVASPTGVVPSYLLRMMPTGSEQLGFGSEAATTVIEPDGRFVFLNVPPGTYTILAQPSVMDFTSGSAFNRFDDAPGFPSGGISVGSMDGAPGLGYLTRSGRPAPVWGRVSIAVGNRDIDDFVLPLRQTVSVRGRVVLENGATPPVSGRFIVRLQPVDGDPSRGQPSGWTVPDDPTNAFTIEGLIGGTYVLRSFNGLGIVSVTWNGRAITDAGFDASAGTDFDDVVVTLTDRTAEISGTVSAIPGPTAAVIAFPVERERWVNYGWQTPRIRTARTGSHGTFAIDDLPKGDYYVVAVDVARVNAWTDPAFLAAAAARATRISLDWGDETSVDLTYVATIVQ